MATYGFWIVLFTLIGVTRWRERRKRGEQKVTNPFVKDNQGRIREAIKNGTKLYAMVRVLDGWVHSDDFWRINVFTEEDTKARGSNNSWRWEEIDPFDPTAKFKVDSKGSFWANGHIPYGRE